MFQKRQKKEIKKFVLLDDTQTEDPKNNEGKFTDNNDNEQDTKQLSKLEIAKKEIKELTITNRKIGTNTRIEELPGETMSSFQRQDDTDKDLQEYIDKRISEIENVKKVDD